jgi:hypothetical protein
MAGMGGDACSSATPVEAEPDYVAAALFLAGAGNWELERDVGRANAFEGASEIGTGARRDAPSRPAAAEPPGDCRLAVARGDGRSALCDQVRRL